MATRKRRKPAKKAAPRRKTITRTVYKTAPRRKRRRKISSSFDTVAKEALMLAAGQVAVDFASNMITSKVGDKVDKLTLGGKLDPVALVLGIVGTNLAKKRSKNRMLFMGMASGGFKKAVSGFIPSPSTSSTTDAEGAAAVSGTGYQDVAAMMIEESGAKINAIPRISGEDQMVNSIPRISGINRQF